MIKTREEFLTGLRTVIGDNASDEVLDLLEYANTIDNDPQIAELQTQITQLNADKEKLVQEKTDLENEWRKRYRDTFFNPNTPPKEDTNRQRENKNGNRKLEDLFVAISGSKKE